MSSGQSFFVLWNNSTKYLFNGHRILTILYYIALQKKITGGYMRIFTLLLFLIPALLLAQDKTLFFSEYIEGSGNSKALEIYNPTGSEVDLSEYQIAQTSNGSNWKYFHTFPSGAKIAAGDVWVITTTQADDILKNAADEVLAFPSVTHHNGDDARALIKISGTDTTFIDVIGVEGSDPGDGWDVAGVALGTKEHTLVRKETIAKGNTDWAASAGSDANSSEWIVKDQDDFSFIGSHTFSGGGPVDAYPTVSNVVLSVMVPTAGDDLTVSADVADDSVGVSAKLTYAINGGTAMEMAMVQGDGDTFSATVPASAYNDGDRVNVEIFATDNHAQETKRTAATFFAGTTPISSLKQLDANNAALYQGYYARVTGDATVANGTFSTTSLSVYMQDGSAGINLFKGGELNTTIVVGNSYTAVGKVLQYNGLIELVPDTPASDIIDNGTSTMPTPVTLTISEILSEPEAYEGFLVKIENVSLDGSSDAWPDTASNANLTVTDDGGTNTFTLRIDRDTDIDSTEAPTFPINVVGVISQFDSKSPFNSGYQILPRSLNDLTEVNSIGTKPGVGLPQVFKLHNAYPNPFNPTTNISFELPAEQAKHVVTLAIYNILGQKVTTLYNGKLAAKMHTFKWDAQNATSGMYYAILKAGNAQQATRLMLIK